MKMISLDNGCNFIEPFEAVVHPSFDMHELATSMDDELRERVHSELAPCTDREFLERYLELADHDLIIG